MPAGIDAERTAALGTAAPSPWVTRWARLVPAGGTVLDVACGAGRHTHLFLAHGHPVVAVDIDAVALGRLPPTPALLRVVADIESHWPIAGHFAGVVVTNYLWRPLLPAIVDAVADGGILLYETFAAGNESYGRPANPDYLLRPGELLGVAAPTLQVVAYEQGRIDTPRTAVVQRLCAVRGPRPQPLDASAGR